MPQRIVVSRSRQIDIVTPGDFPFTRELIPALNGDGQYPDYIKEYRARAWEAYQSLPLPTPQDEAWRRTDLNGMEMHGFHLPAPGENLDQPPIPQELLKPLVGEAHAGRVLLTPGQKAQVELDPSLAEMGVIFTDLETAERDYPQVTERILGKIIQPEAGKFAALAGALAQSGVLLYVPRGLHLTEPLHSILWGPGIGLAYFSHILVWLEEDCSLTYIHEVASPTEAAGQTLHAGLVEMHVGPAAHLRFVELQSWGEHVWNFSHERIQVERDANLDWIFGAVGSHLTKNFSDLDLVGIGATGRMSGFYFTDSTQHLDHDTQQNHLAANTTSDLLFKGVLKDRSRSVWQGMIYVAPGAQKTDGYQANRNLVLSPKARADSIPGLEILADDVRCTHGATVGKIDQDQVFYLRSRGIPQKEAERVIVEGFFDPIMQRIPFEGVRTRFQSAIHEKMG